MTLSDQALEDAFHRPLGLARRVMTQNIRDPWPKIYALHAPEVECIGKGKSHKPYEFGVKASIATTLKRCKGGQFAIHAKALPGWPYDGHTLKTVIPEIEALTGATLGVGAVAGGASYLAGAGASQLPIKNPSFLVFFIREFGSLTHSPGSRELEAPTKPQKSAIYCSGSLRKSPGARCPGNLSTGYPQVIHTREFGEFEQPPKPMV